MPKCHPTSTPINTHAKLSASDGPPVANPTKYHSIVGALQYLTLTYPDITYVVQQVCLYMHDRHEPHLVLIKQILHYVKGTLDYGLHLHVSPVTSLTAYFSADWTGCTEYHRSTSDIVSTLGQPRLLVVQEANHSFPIQCGGGVPCHCLCHP